MQRDPVREWREQYARRWLNIDFAPLPDTRFRASVEPILDHFRIVRTRLSPGVTFRDEELIKDGDDTFSLLIAQSNGLDVVHQKREARLSYGDAALLHLCATGSVGSPRSFEYIAVLAPHAELEARGARPNDAIMKRVPQRTDVLQLLRGYLRSVERFPAAPPAEPCETMHRHILDLAALAIMLPPALGDSSLGAVAAARLSIALAQLGARFQEPELSVAAVASSIGISPRYLERLLERSGTSFTVRVNELRLQRAFTLLTEAGDGRRISDIALDVGFSDISHFNRLFRARFGDTPSGVRASGRNPDPRQE